MRTCNLQAAPSLTISRRQQACLSALEVAEAGVQAAACSAENAHARRAQRMPVWCHRSPADCLRGSQLAQYRTRQGPGRGLVDSRPAKPRDVPGRGRSSRRAATTSSRTYSPAQLLPPGPVQRLQLDCGVQGGVMCPSPMKQAPIVTVETVAQPRKGGLVAIGARL